MPAKLPARARLAPLLLAAALGACERAGEAWLADLRSEDPWHRRVAAQALGTAEDDEVATHLRWLLLVLDDPEPDVADAAQASFAALTERDAGSAARLLARVPTDRPELRQRVLGTLRGLAESGHAAARHELVLLLRAETESPDPRRARLAREWLERFE